ncbi:MAG TPA: protein kinase [Gemmatimonadales bacterium]|nr:protein kinase [Gemmatimonadales bacterium]
MTDPKRWARIEALFADLDGAPTDVRDAVLAATSDPEVAAEVARLLRAQDRLNSAPGKFLGELDATRARALMPPPQGPPASIGRYPVVRPLGRGGMGEVYLARDPRLDRPVAIKLLPPHLDRDARAVRRLESEARTASALDHPNIATVYEIAETDDGRAFIVMAYYDGETLRERLSRGSLAVDEAIGVAIQLAEGLDAAHRTGIIHRDIKPENVMLTGEGRVVILDFGIAKAASADLVTSGLMRGTAAYMSPEQSRGEATDPRTDLWSTGVVLHELLTGSRPFPGEGSALVHAIREDSPAPLAPGRSGVPPALAELVRQCLGKTPHSRLRSAGELAAALHAIRDGRAPRRPERRRRLVALAGVALATVAALVMLLRGRTGQPLAALSGTTGEPAPGIAVLPFEVRGSDLQDWREGMVDLLAANLDGVEGLRGIDSRTVLARWARSFGDGEAPDLGSAIAVARDVGAQFAVLGTMVPNGDELRLTARVHSVPDGADLASFSVDGPADSLFSLVDRLTIKVLAVAWQGRGRPTAAVDLGRITTRSLPALRAFLRGERLLRQSEYAGAVGAYREAIRADSTFAFALYHLGMAQVWLGNTEAGGLTWQEAFAAAVRHSGQLPAREQLLLRLALTHNVPGPHDQLATLRLAEVTVTRYPDEAEAWYLLGEVYFHSGDQLLQAPGAVDTALERAVALDPGMSMLYDHLLQNAIGLAPDSARAHALLDQYQKFGSRARWAPQAEQAFALAFGDSAARRRALIQLAAMTEGDLVEMTQVLRHPRFWRDLAALLEAHDRSPTLEGTWLTDRLVRLSLDCGDMEKAMRYVADPLLPAGYRALDVYRARLGGAPLPDSMLRTALAMPPTGSEVEGLTGYQLALAAALAAEEGRWTDHEAARGRLVAVARVARDRGDSATAYFVEGSVLALHGYGLGRLGQPKTALEELTAGQQQVTRSGSVAAASWNAIIRWWIGDLLLADKQPEEAARYFSSIRHDPFAAERVAPIYEQLGRLTEAREAYAMVAEVWKDADPAFRLRGDSARAAAVRLASRAQGARTPNTGVSPLGTLEGTVRN